jgi:hypothetical protein
MQDKIIISVGKDWDGFTFRLRPKSKQFLKGVGPKTKSLSSRDNAEPLMSQVSISFDEKKGFEVLHAPIYKYVVEMLTGISYEEIAKLGGAQFVDENEKVIYDTENEL